MVYVLCIALFVLYFVKVNYCSQCTQRLVAVYSNRSWNGYDVIGFLVWYPSSIWCIMASSRQIHETWQCEFLPENSLEIEKNECCEWTIYFDKQRLELENFSVEWKLVHLRKNDILLSCNQLCLLQLSIRWTMGCRCPFQGSFQVTEKTYLAKKLDHLCLQCDQPAIVSGWVVSSHGYRCLLTCPVLQSVLGIFRYQGSVVLRP